MGFLSTRTAGASGGSPAYILGARQLVAGIIDHLVFGSGWWLVWLHAGQFRWQRNRRDQQSDFHDPADQHASVGKQPDVSFARQVLWRTSERGPDGSEKLLPP
jgi:hypothetical protein